MSLQLSIAKQAIVVVIVLLLVELVFVCVIASALADTRAKLVREKHVFEVVAQSSQIANTTQELLTNLIQDGIKIADMIPGSPRESVKFEIELASQFRKFRMIAQGDKAAMEILNEQQYILQEIKRIHAGGASYYAEHLDNKALAYARSMIESGGDISGKYDRLLARYKSQGHNAPQQTSSAISSLKQTTLVALLLNIIGGMVIAYLFSNSLKSRIALLTENMARFKRKEPLLPKTHAKDEIGKLDSLFHQMIDAVNQTAHNERVLVEESSDVICTIDEDGMFLAVNAACVRQWGYEKDALEGEHVSMVLADATLLMSQLENLSPQRSTSVDTTVKRANGKSTQSHWSCYRSGKDRSVICFVRDLSEANTMEAMLKAREEQVRTLMRNIPVGILVVDDKGVIKTANTKMESLANCERGSLIQQSIETVLDNISADELRTNATDGGARRVMLKRSGREALESEVVVKPLDSRNGIDTLVVVEDIHERVRLENMRKDFVTLLREDLGESVRTVRTIVGAAYPGAESPSTESPTLDFPKSPLSRVVFNTDRLLKLIDELLNVETLRPGTVVGELKSVNANDVIQPSAESLRDFARGHSVEIQVQKLDEPIIADADSLVRVVVNLLSNAIKFSPKDSEVLVAAEVKDDFVEFSVVDQGRGVPAEKQASIFNPYVQTDASDKSSGTGLGLPICKSIVEAHGGTIGVVSDGKGSRFWFRIPKAGAT